MFLITLITFCLIQSALTSVESNDVKEDFNLFNDEADNRSEENNNNKPFETNNNKNKLIGDMGTKKLLYLLSRYGTNSIADVSRLGNHNNGGYYVSNPSSVIYDDDLELPSAAAAMKMAMDKREKMNNIDFMRFGRSDQKFLRFGRNLVRAVRDKENFLRFGRSIADMKNSIPSKKPVPNDIFIRYGRDPNSYL